eukprot:scaffold111435_cov17-Prasinocladus_malaysianus.AAC.1
MPLETEESYISCNPAAPNQHAICVTALRKIVVAMTLYQRLRAANLCRLSSSIAGKRCVTQDLTALIRRRTLRDFTKIARICDGTSSPWYISNLEVWRSRCETMFLAILLRHYY